MHRTWGRRLHSPCTMEVLLAQPGAGETWTETLVERLVMRYSPVNLTAQGVDSTGSTASLPHSAGQHSSYARFTGVVRSACTAAVALPAHRVASKLSEAATGPDGKALDPNKLALPHMRFRVLVSHPDAPSRHAATFAATSPTSTFSIPDIGTPFGVFSAAITFTTDVHELAQAALKKRQQQGQASRGSPAMAESAMLAPSAHSNRGMGGGSSGASRPLTTLIIHDYAGGERTIAPPPLPAPSEAPAPAPLPREPAASQPLTSVAALAATVVRPSHTSGPGAESAPPSSVAAATFTPQLVPMADAVAGGGASHPTALSLPEGVRPESLTGGGSLKGMGEWDAPPPPSSLVMGSTVMAQVGPSPPVGPSSPTTRAARGGGTPHSIGTSSSAGSSTPTSITTPLTGGGKSAVCTPLLTPGAMGGEAALSSAPAPLHTVSLAHRAVPSAPFASIAKAKASTPQTLLGMMCKANGSAKPAESRAPRSKAHAAGSRLIVTAGAGTPTASPPKKHSQSGILAPITETFSNSSGDSPRVRGAPMRPAPAWVPSPFAVLGGATGGGAGALLLRLESALHVAPAVMPVQPPSTAHPLLPTSLSQAKRVLKVA